MKKTLINSMALLTLCTTMFAYSYHPYTAGNGDVYGADNDGDGRTESIYVESYRKSDGTLVRSHYRAGSWE
tara:strand:- start:356 stop:568 length:213 start_codon:yes stop_codon:yes gene_type:complete